MIPSFYSSSVTSKLFEVKRGSWFTQKEKTCPVHLCSFIQAQAILELQHFVQTSLVRYRQGSAAEFFKVIKEWAVGSLLILL